MLHLKFALNLETLADEMIEAISSVWTNPFESPVVIFPDPKLEQWFRLRWMKKKGVLANLNKSTIDRFLFDILVGDNRKLKKLSSEMLANVIMAYLLGKEDGTTPNYETLDSNVAKYLTKMDGEKRRLTKFDFLISLTSWRACFLNTKRAVLRTFCKMTKATLLREFLTIGLRNS